MKYRNNKEQINRDYLKFKEKNRNWIRIFKIFWIYNN